MRKAIFAVLVVFFFFMCITEDGVTSVAQTDGFDSTEMVIEKTADDSLVEYNELLYHAFVESLSQIESSSRANVVSNRGGVKYYGWAQLSAGYIRSANKLRSVYERTGTLKHYKHYYRTIDAFDFEKTKEIIYWVNKQSFDEYDNANKQYDHKLWHRVLIVHNSGARSSYRKRIMNVYNKKVQELQYYD